MKTDHSNTPALFQETQKFRQWWIWLIVFLPMAIVLGILLYQMITGQPVGDEPAPDWLLFVLLFAIPIPVAVGFFIARLTTRVDEHGFYYGWNIFSSKLNKFSWSDIQSLTLTRYGFVGYGVHYARKYGTVHNVSGNVGLYVETKRGSRFIVGTTKPDELDRALREVAARGINLPYVDARDVAESQRSSGGVPPAQLRSYT